MRLRRLTGLEREKIQNELSELLERIAYYKRVLGDPALVRAIIKEELQEVKEEVRLAPQDPFVRGGEGP